jgi:DNA-3-methyladenine glycosylase II
MDTVAADEHLTRDPRLAPLVARFDLPPIAAGGDLYFNLIRTIIYQQLSGKAAQTIHGRFLGLFADEYPHSGELLAHSAEALRTVGVSRQKAGYLHNVAEHWEQEKLASVDWSEYEDETLLRELTTIKGVGQWTVEMLLMFTLQRPDILPLDDLAIRGSIESLYGISGRGKAHRAELVRATAHWQPYRSRACRYLWAWQNAK